MGIPLHLYILAISLCHLLCTQRVNCDNSEIICSAWKQVRCTPSKNIRVHDVIYGHVVGRNECNTQPTTNCTAPNGFCEVAEKVEGRPVSEWLRSNETISPPPCGGKDIYIFVNYSCVEILRLSGENFAFKKPAQQSTTSNDGIASRAVDGNKNRYYSSGSCTHTAEQTAPWWRVDLQQRIAVTHVKIVNRNRIGKRLCGFEIRIGDSLENNGITSRRCGTQQHIPSNQEGIVACVPTVVGRYVTIVIPGEKKALTLCEVEVYGTKEDQFTTPSAGQTTQPSSTTENSKPVNTAAKKEDDGSTVVVWHIVVTLVSGFILGILFSYIVSCSRRRWFRNRNAEPKTTVVDTTYQELDLSKLNTEDNYQSLRVNATNNDTAVNDDESNYTELKY